MQDNSMQRPIHVLAVILFIVQIPLVVVCGIHFLNIQQRAEWLIVPGTIGAFVLAAVLLLGVALRQHNSYLLLAAPLRWTACCFTIGAWVYMAYTLRAPALLLPLLTVLWLLLRVCGLVPKQQADGHNR
jgi:hypothetical protein